MQTGECDEAGLASLSQSFLSTVSSRRIRSCAEFQQTLQNAREELARLVEHSAIQASDGHIVYKFSLSSRGRTKQTDGQFVIADLSSSDKLRKSVFLGDKMVETIEKNSSLISFSKAVSYLLENKRDLINPAECRLVEALYEALGGNSLTCYVVSVSLEDQDRERTLNTLLFAQNISHLFNLIVFTPEQQASNAKARKSSVQPRTDSHIRSTTPGAAVDRYLLPKKQSALVAEVQEPQTPTGSTWMDKCNMLLGNNFGEIDQLKQQNSELQTQVNELQRIVRLTKLEQSAVSKDSPVKNMSFFSVDHDQSLQSILKMAEKQLLYQSNSPNKIASAIDSHHREPKTGRQQHTHFENHERHKARTRDLQDSDMRRTDQLIAQLRHERDAFEAELLRSTTPSHSSSIKRKDCCRLR